MEQMNNITFSLAKEVLIEALGDVESIERVSGGLVHYVFRVKKGKKEYYLKIRGDQYVHMPTVNANPEDIYFEAKAVQITNGILEDVFPKLVALSREKGAFIATSIMQSKDNLLLKLRSNEVRESDMHIIGHTLRTVHSSLAEFGGAIRDDNDDQYYRENLTYRLGFNPELKVLHDLIRELSLENRTLIVGDLSPKNLGIVSSKLRICDLEAVHRGNPVFDIGFFIGHIFVHAVECGYSASKYTLAFLNGYNSIENAVNSVDKENLKLKRISLGTQLYRLDNDFVPYPIEVSNNVKQNIANNLKNLLSQVSFEWEEMELLYVNDDMR